jgi:hypothetical protein
VYFFCEDRDHQKQLLKNFLSVLITQLIKAQPICIKEVEAAKARNNRSLTETDYVKLAKTIMNYFRQVIAVVDTLDESCEVRKFVQIFDEFLACSQGVTRTFIFATSRDDINIERLITPLATCKLSLINRMRHDIETYVAAEVTERIRTRILKLRDAGLATEIIHCLVDHADGV